MFCFQLRKQKSGYELVDVQAGHSSSRSTLAADIVLDLGYMPIICPASCPYSAKQLE